MTDLVAADVTVTVDKSTQRIGGRNVRSQNATLVFGDGSKTYPTGGVPVPGATGLGFNRKLLALNIIDEANGDGLMYKWDAVNKKIRIWLPTQQTGSTGNRAGVEYTGGSTAVAATTLSVELEGY